MILRAIAYLWYYLEPIRCSGSHEEASYVGTGDDIGALLSICAFVAFIWYVVVILVSLNGFVEIMRKFKKVPYGHDPSNTNIGVSILRPLKGIDPQMEVCLESSFLQDYPVESFEIIFCIANDDDPSIPLVEKLCAKYPHIHSSIMIGEEHYGPNPKINNLAKGYKAAKFDIVWVQDSNVKVFPMTMQKSVNALSNSTNNGSKTSRPVKLIHHLPLAVATNNATPSNYGAQCDELFMSTAHSKFYVSINKVSLAPCVNGKSNLYRKSDLDYAVFKIGEGFPPSENGKSGVLERDAAFYSLKPGNGLKLFSRYIGEDNMIAIALWDHCHSRTGMTGDVAVQPLGGINTIRDYCDRRTRWLRARKYMVLAATLLEPTTECVLSGIYGTFGISVLFMGCHFRLPLFVIHTLIWFTIDRCQYLSLSQFFDQQPKGLANFAKFWAFRELLALPVWVAAMSGHTIDWRGKPFRIKRDLSAEEL